MNTITIDRLNEVKGNLSQEEFARSINSSQSVISKILNGEPASINVLTAIAQNYHVSIDWLLGLSSRKSLHGYSTYDNQNPITYADVVSLFISLMEHNSIDFSREPQDYDFYDPINQTNANRDTITINDCYLGNLIYSASSIYKINPETVPSWMDSVAENYDTTLLKWSNVETSIFNSSINFRSSLDLLNERKQNN